METESKKETKLKEVCAVCGKRKSLDPNDGSTPICSCQSKSKTKSTPTKTPEKDAALLQPGDLLADWLILEKIGTGALTRVYKARAKESEELFVVKELRRTFAANPRNAKMFEVESKEAIEHLHHPNIVRVFASGKTPKGLPYQVAEYVESPSLFLKMSMEGPLSEQNTLELFLPLCDALVFAHEKNIIHGSIQPTNIFLDLSKNIVELADFGLAKVLPNATRETKFLTPEGERMGDPQYASPEYLMGERLDARSDIYSLGCVMYQVLTGKTPFTGASRMQMALSNLSDQARPLSSESEGNEKKSALENVIGRCLEKDPARRYQSAIDLRADLKAAKAGKYIEALPPPPRPYKQDIKEVKKYFNEYKVPLYIFAVCIVLFMVLSLSENYEPMVEEVKSMYYGLTTPKLAQAEHQNTPIENNYMGVLHTKYGNWLGENYNLPEINGVTSALAKKLDLKSLELVHSKLKGVDFTNARLEKSLFIGVSFNTSNFDHSHLDNATFIDCDLRGCYFKYASLRGAYFLRSNLDNIDCRDADFTSAFFDRVSSARMDSKGANFEKAVVVNSTGKLVSNGLQKKIATKEILADPPDALPRLLNSGHKLNYKNANLDGAILVGLNLTNTDFLNSSFRGADLRNSNLRTDRFVGLDMRGADLTGAYLCNSDLTGVDLSGANLENANLSYANLSNARLSGANLKGANLRGTSINQCYLEGADLTGVNFDRYARYVQLYKTALPKEFNVDAILRLDSEGLYNTPLNLSLGK